MPLPTRFLWCLLLAGGCSLAPAARAQHGGGGMGGGGGRSGGMPGGGGFGFPGGAGDRSGFPSGKGGLSPGRSPDSAGTASTMRGGLQLGPPGRWWDDKHFAKDLKLRPDQQRRMDALFEENRASLLKRLGALEQEQNRMEALTHAKAPDQSGLFAQIDRVSQARAELEKANTHLLLQLRGEMDPDQIALLEQHR